MDIRHGLLAFLLLLVLMAGHFDASFAPSMRALLNFKKQLLLIKIPIKLAFLEMMMGGGDSKSGDIFGDGAFSDLFDTLRSTRRPSSGSSKKRPASQKEPSGRNSQAERFYLEVFDKDDDTSYQPPGYDEDFTVDSDDDFYSDRKRTGRGSFAPPVNVNRPLSTSSRPRNAKRPVNSYSRLSSLKRHLISSI